MINKIVNFLHRDVSIHLIQLITALLPNSYVTTRLRGLLIGPFLGRCGKNFRIASGVILNCPGRLRVGDNVYIAHNVWINAAGGIKIGSNSIIGPMCVLATSKHRYENNMATNKGILAPIKIGKGVWLASHVIVTDGVTIGNGALIGAGAVVTHTIESRSMAGGIPAKKIKNL